MARRYWTADFHLSMPEIIEYEDRPYDSVQEMDKDILAKCHAL